MSELQQAADACGNLAKSYRSVLTLADAVGKLGNLDAHRNELERQRDAVLAEVQAARAMLTGLTDLATLQQAKASAQAALVAAGADTAREQASLAALKQEQAAAEAAVKALKAEAAEVEKQLATMRGELEALKRKFAS